MKLKPKLKSTVPFISKVKKKKKNKDTTGAEVDASEVSDDDLYSDFSDASDDEDEEVDETAPEPEKKRPSFSMERTWSVKAFNLSSHSAGLVYLDDSDDSDSDDSSSCDSFGEDDYDGNKVTRKKKRAQGNKGTPVSSRRSSLQFKQDLKQRNRASDIIEEGDEDEDDEDQEGGTLSNDNLSNDTNGVENESDDDSPSFFKTPFTFKQRPPSISELMRNDDSKIDSGYSSDSALVRKRMEMLKDEQKKQSDSKKKKGGKKKISRNKKEKKKGNKNDGGSLEGDSTATTVSAESLEHQSNHTTKTASTRKKKTKKKTKKKKPKDGKAKKKRAVISFVVDGDDEACADFDKRLQEIEQFEASLFEERKAIQKERETMAFERESMEMRMDEEARLCDELKHRIKELEQEVHSQQISNAGNTVESMDEKNGMKMDFMREKREFHLQLMEKDQEIEDLKMEVRDLRVMQCGTRADDDSNGLTDGKSRERLQGELLQMTAKLAEKEAILESTSRDLDIMREEVAALKTGKETQQLKNTLLTAHLDNKKLKQELENERQQSAAKLKDKDETVTFLMNELTRLKLEQSKNMKRRGSFK